MFVASPGVQLAVTRIAQRVRLTRTQTLHSQLLQVFDHHWHTGRGQCTATPTAATATATAIAAVTCTSIGSITCITVVLATAVAGGDCGVSVTAYAELAVPVGAPGEHSAGVRQCNLHSSQ